MSQVSDHIADLFEACKIGDYEPIRELQALEREAGERGMVTSVRVGRKKNKWNETSNVALTV